MDFFYLIVSTCMILVGSIFFIIHIRQCRKLEDALILDGMMNEVYNSQSRNTNTITLPSKYDKTISLVLLSKDKNKVFFELVRNNKPQIIKVLKKGHHSVLSIEAIRKLKHKNIVKFHKIFAHETQRKTNDILYENTIRNEKNNESNDTFSNEMRWFYMEFLDTYVSYHEFNQDEYHITNILYDVLKGLYFLYQNRIIHGNLTLKNIRGACPEFETIFKIMNFDMSQVLPENDIGIKQVQTGSPLFIAPEVFESHLITQKADIYSLGAVGYYLLNDIKCDYNKASLLLKNIKCVKCRQYRTNANFKQCRKCRDIKMCHKCKKCEKCNKCDTCDICADCLNCSKCIMCDECKKYSKNSIIFDKIANKLPKIVKCEDSKLETLITQCLDVYERRPDIKTLLNDKNTRSLFDDFWNDSDFPNYKNN